MRSWKGDDGVFGNSNSRSRAQAGTVAAWLVAAALAMALGPSLASARVRASILVDTQTGKILEARNADSLCYPASLTKLMTLYLTFQQLSTGKMTLGQELPVSSHAAAQAPTKLYLRPGERISVRSAILAITTRSANDAAVVLAEAVAGSEWKFAQMMNQEARELRMDRTTFRNASGLPNSRQRTTARDMSKLALAILHNFPQYYSFFKAGSFDFRGKTIYGHDHLLARYPGVDGMKTGYTEASGFNIVTSAVRDHRRLIGVVMGGRSARSRDRQMISLLNRGFATVPSETLTAATHHAAAPTTRHAVHYEKVAEQTTEQDDQDSRPDLGWIVQVGGTFHTLAQARSVLRSALRTEPALLRDAKPLAVKLRGRRYFARFTDMSEATALDARHALREKKYTCGEFQIQRSGVVMASTGR
jgi:D-alanyl-D-alanine carboxypeptidase